MDGLRAGRSLLILLPKGQWTQYFAMYYHISSQVTLLCAQGMYASQACHILQIFNIYASGVVLSAIIVHWGSASICNICNELAETSNRIGPSGRSYQRWYEKTQGNQRHVWVELGRENCIGSSLGS